MIRMSNKKLKAECLASKEQAKVLEEAGWVVIAGETVTEQEAKEAANKPEAEKEAK